VIKTKELTAYDKLWREAYGKNLREPCKQRDTFYNPFMIELSIITRSLHSRF
jgi:hypothetical protein